MIYNASLQFLCLVFFSQLNLGIGCGFDCQGEIEESFTPHGNVELLQSFWENSEEDSDSVVRFYLYKREISNNPEVYTIVDQKANGGIFNKFQSNLTTKIIIHGWKACVPSLITETFKNAYLSVGDFNLVMVDWSKTGSMLGYPWAKSNIPMVANEVATFIDKLSHRYKIRPEDLHVIGHSLGAHIAGIAGRLINSGRVGRISGLDPAGPLFDLKDETSILTKSSAAFVDIIHSCGRYLGITKSLGHVDYYPNGGHFIQPGCGFDLSGGCSHRRSYGYFTESIVNKNGFQGLMCSSWIRYSLGICDSWMTMPMGEHIPKSTRGTYFLRTNRQEPFALR